MTDVVTRRHSRIPAADDDLPHVADFTGIDPSDNPRMADVAERVATTHSLFPVVNVTLNLTAERNNAWAERKGESFTITPCACGAAYLHKSDFSASDLLGTVARLLGGFA